jgi:hypothetical protein
VNYDSEVDEIEMDNTDNHALGGNASLVSQRENHSYPTCCFGVVATIRL